MTISAIKRTDQAQDKQVSYLLDVADTIRDNAVEDARKKVGFAVRDMSLEYLLNYQPVFFDYFRYGLASNVAHALATHDQNIQAIYFHDPTANSDAESGIRMQNPTVHLLVRGSLTAALESFVASLDRALTANLKELPCSLFAKRDFILDVKLVSEEDVQLGRGFAVLISSAFAPALKIWERKGK